jgi:hypothetical protein
MPFETSWLLEKRVIVFHIWGRLSIEENQDLNAELGAFIRSGIKPVHLIVVFGADYAAPLDLQLLATGTPIKDKNMGQAAIIGGSPVIRFMAHAVGKYNNRRVHNAKSIEEAYRKFCEIDASLPLDYPKVRLES